ncbi:SDR family oxidoreductase [Pseudarthrobacter siccitolerans]|uniref:SDR family oxidoreductase n=1 Tax=Pseudarthrobacter siccitolerans TaxID=861266 RepID=UPI002694299D
MTGQPSSAEPPGALDTKSLASWQRAEFGKVIDQVVQKTGSLDILVNNAGILRDGVLWKTTDADWQSVLEVHLTRTFRLTRAAVRPMRVQGFGRIVNVTSYSGMHGNFGQANYAAAKAGIIGFTKTGAKELANFGITVKAVSPNAQTRMISSIGGEAYRAHRDDPLRRFADPHEIAIGVGFLASDEAAYITGVMLPVDGGVSMSSSPPTANTTSSIVPASIGSSRMRCLSSEIPTLILRAGGLKARPRHFAPPRVLRGVQPTPGRACPDDRRSFRRPL